MKEFLRLEKSFTLATIFSSVDTASLRWKKRQPINNSVWGWLIWIHIFNWLCLFLSFLLVLLSRNFVVLDVSGEGKKKAKNKNSRTFTFSTYPNIFESKYLTFFNSSIFLFSVSRGEKIILVGVFKKKIKTKNWLFFFFSKDQGSMYVCNCLGSLFRSLNCLCQIYLIRIKIHRYVT